MITINTSYNNNNPESERKNENENENKFTIGSIIENDEKFKKPRNSLFRKFRQSISLNDYFTIDY